MVATQDYRNYRITNQSVLITMAIGLTWITYSHRMQGFATGLYGTIVGFSLLIPFYALGGMTAGDVKWLAALGPWYGPKGILGLFVISGIILGLMSLYWMLEKKSAAPPSENIDQIYSSDLRKQYLIPYALAVAISVMAIESIRIFNGS